MHEWGRAGVGRRRAIAIVVVSCAVLALPAGASAVGLQARERQAAPDAAKPFFDSRVGARRAATRATPTPQERSAQAQLQSKLGRQAAIGVDPVTGTARSVQRLDGTLTGPASGDRGAIAMTWLRAHRAALGLDASDVAGLTLADRSESRFRPITHLRYRQSYAGIPTFDNSVRVNLDGRGRILNVTGTPIAGLRVQSVTPRLTAPDAMRALQRDVGVQRVTTVVTGPEGVRRTTRFSRGDFARLVLFGGAGGARLAWHLTYQATSLAYYDAVVDATDGAILFRQSLTKFDDADQTVFPDYPGAEEADDPKGANNVPADVNFEDAGWLPDAAVTLSGSNAHVWSDVDDDNAPDTAPFDEEVRRADGDADFDDTFQDFPAPPGWTNACDFTNPTPGWPDPLATAARCSWDPTDRDSWLVNREQNGVEAFFLVNDFHDHLESAPIGFDEAAGNFEGDDPVEVNADDGADTDGAGGPDGDHINNANMSTPPDGLSPRMQMYLFEYDPEVDSGDPDAPFFTFRNINGGDDAATVWHEYTHGLSNRLVVNDDGSGALSSPHAGAMGEAWSDWYALDLLHRRDLEIDDPDRVGEVDIGMYSDAVFTATRFEPIDCPVNAVAPRCPGGVSTGRGGYTFGDFGKVYVGPEVHSDGEIWMQTLWDLRSSLVEGFGDEGDGSDVAEFLLTEAMRLSPPEPSFLDMRNAILAAAAGIGDDDLAAELRGVIWDVFAGRGMGFFASAVDSSDVTPTEDFSMPPTPGAATGTTKGTITSADNGLPIGNVTVGFGGQLTDQAFPDYLATRSAADGRYSLTAPAGRYGDLVFRAGGGFDVVTVPDFTVTAGVTRTQNAALRRDWAASKGGAGVIIDDSKYDNTGAGFGCGLKQLIDQSQGAGNSAFNPTSLDPENPHLGPPTALIKLPRPIDITAFGLDPSNTCGDDPSSATKNYRIETSSDGVHFAVAKLGSFGPQHLAKLNIVTPTANAKNVHWVRLTTLSPQSAEPGESGVDFIDFSELEVFGGPRNQPPKGALHVSKPRVNPRKAVLFGASFTDPDSKITGYRWDFDGNGTVDRATTTPTTSFAYSRGGDYTARVQVLDFRGGAGTGTVKVHVTTAPHVGTLPKRGTKGRVRFRASCDAGCTTTARLTLSKKLAKRLGLKKKRTVGTLRRTLAAGSSKRLTVKLSSRARRAIRRHDRKSVKATLTVIVRYADGRLKSAHRVVTIRL